jgi:two-component system cell cycle response regulator DivK
MVSSFTIKILLIEEIIPMTYILLVEDDQMNADMVIRILEAENFTVKHTIRGLEGAKMARQERPDLILMDFDLPDVDGRNIAFLLKKQLGGDAAPPMVAVTARTGDVEKRLAQRLGFAAFLCKPFSPEQLLNLVKTLLN